MIHVHILPIIPHNQNYAYFIQTAQGVSAIIDPGEADPIIEFLDAHDFVPDYIINTHHHWDHVDGNAKITKRYGTKIIAPAKEKQRIGQVDIPLNDNESFDFGGDIMRTIETPGHTAGALCYYFEESGIVFTGDTLFSMGCGRLFEGTPEQMYISLQRLMELPDETLVYCGHEYTKGNAGFCLSYDRNNPVLRARIEEVKALRKEGKPTLPTSIGLEKQTNIFMQAKSAEEFAALRKKKDNF
ncbi:MAG: hydroxyacylglutathione hydrolase [Alphaproteobacteria bacterium]